jgi:glycerol uptake facilitator-like aquaporin
VTFSNYLNKPNKKWWLYIVAQFLGALIAGLLGNYFLIEAEWFFDVTPAPYRSHEDILDCFYDFVGEAVGFMIFMFAIFRVNQMKYSSGEYFSYLIVSIMLFMSRAYLFFYLDSL